MIPKGYEPSKPVVIFFGIVLIVAAAFSVRIIIQRNKALSGEIRYTIGETIKRYLTANGRDIDFEYQVNGNTYEGSAGYAYESEVPGGKYWVKYSVEYPEISKIYQNMPVDARIDTIPPNGFKGRYNYEQFLQWKEWAAQQKRKK